MMKNITLYNYIANNSNINETTPGWEFISKPNKGGMFLGPAFYVDDLAFRFIKLSIEYKSAENAYVGLFFYDEQGTLLPDAYHGLDPSKDFMKYQGLFYGREHGAYAKPFFQSTEDISLKNLKIEAISEKGAMLMCDSLYNELPPLEYIPPMGRFKHLSKTIDALKSGTQWRVVMLGDSIINDTFNSGFQALIKRIYPSSNFRYISAVRGSGGCLHYHKVENFKQYVSDNKPDLLIIGGISQLFKTTEENAIQYIQKVVDMARKKHNCEVMLITGPLGMAWKEKIDKKIVEKTSMQYNAPIKFWEAQKALANKLNIAFQDQGALWRNYLSKANKPQGWFNRDMHHGNSRGEQIVARMIEAFFKPDNQ